MTKSQLQKNTEDNRTTSPSSGSCIGVCSWSLQPRDPQHLLDSVRRLEVQGVQIALSPVVNDPETWAGAVDLLRGAGVSILSGMMATAGEDYSTLESIARTGGVRPDHTWEANRQHALAVAELAAASGIELVTFHVGFIPEAADDPERPVLLDRLRWIADAFAERGLRLGLETGQETAETLEQALAELNRANVGVNFDPANMILYGKGDPVDALRRLLPHIVQIHVKDAVPTTTEGQWGVEVPVGEGAVDWDAFLEAAAEIRPAVNFVIEREAGSSREADIIAARTRIAAYLNRL